jgi:hypothetical protein
MPVVNALTAQKATDTGGIHVEATTAEAQP